MPQRVVSTSTGHRLEGGSGDIDLVNSFLSHLWSRAFSPATVRAYAYDLLNFLRFLGQRSARFQDVVATDLFDYLDWQQRSTPGTAKVVRLTPSPWRRASDDEPADRGSAGLVRVLGDHRRAW